MGELVDKLGNKAEGLLIKSSDWNVLVQAVEDNDTAIDALSASVDERFKTVDTQITNLDTKVDTVRTDLKQLVSDLSDSVDAKLANLHIKIDTVTETLAALAARINPIITSYCRLTLNTGRLNYAIGQLAEIIARVTDLEGHPIDVGGGRPWIDFVTSWGQLKPADGFQSRGGVGDRTLSVQVNTQGEARVFLRSDFAEGFSDDEEDEVSAALTTVVSGINISVANTILDAQTPVEAKNKGAFRTMSLEYDRSDAVTVRKFMDAHYLRNPYLVTGKLTPTFTHRWRDYRATVLAFVKKDSDPRTPDESRGVSSIQITFRDWIGPWLALDYLGETTSLVEDAKNKLNPKITGDYLQSVGLFKQEVDDRIRNKGVMGKFREFKVLRDALDRVTGPSGQPPAFLNKLTRTMKDAIDIQHALEGAQTAAIGAPERTQAFQAFTNAAVRSDTDVSEVSKVVNDIRNQVGQIDQKIQQQVNQSVSKSVSELEKPGGAIDSIKKSVQSVSGQVNEIQKLGRVEEVKNQLTKIEEVSNRLDLFMARR
jgi:archaellum component FlaC